MSTAYACSWADEYGKLGYNMKIVIIEDEIRIREGLGRLIEKLSTEYEVAGAAENGQEGCELVRAVKPDVIVTDIKMPLMDGLEMLTALYEEGCKAKAIVLSAYSEFEYARQALRLGVKEYLLKPIVVSDISKSLQRVKEEIRRESVKDKLSINGLDQIFTGILWGSIQPDKTLEELLEEKYKLSADTRYIEFCVYLGEDYTEIKARRQRELAQLFEQRKDLSYLCLEAERENMLVLLIYHYKDAHILERWMQQEMLGRRGANTFAAAGWNADLTLGQLKGGVEQLCRSMEWNISLGDDVIVSYPKVNTLQTSPCIYPIELEKQMKIHICSNESKGVDKALNYFTAYFQKGTLFDPKEIKECYVRFLWSMINVAKETGILDHENLEQQSLLEQVMGARTQKELQTAVYSLKEKIHSREEDDTIHLTVKRAQSLIQEFYQTGITLEEIADRLNITPEYLGTRFHKELGVNFSTYIKNYRMTKAKELLIGTQMKLYEIAAKVGYSDPKYFSRVFKETTGQLPADYRKTHN